MTERLSMLCVFAHPDDECLGPGGTIAKYAMEGVEVNLLTFTRGEAGSIGISKELDPEDLAQRRVEELSSACSQLGIANHRILGVADKGVHKFDSDTAVREILADIKRFRPQVLMTFHHGGISGHSDHIAITGLVRAAFASTREPVKLYEYGIPGDVAVHYDRPSMVVMPEDDIGARIEIPDEAMSRKIAAIKAHVTQIDFYRSLTEKFDYRSVARPEHFLLSATRLPAPSGVENDLFAGIRAEGHR